MKQIPAYINGDGGQARDFTFVDNAVQINIKGMLTDNAEALNKVYNVAVGENFTVNYLYQQCCQYLKSDFSGCLPGPKSGRHQGFAGGYFTGQKITGLPAHQTV